MATYKASPGYAIAVGDKTIRFGWRGDYATNDPAEIAVLDGLAPKWITKLEDVSPAETIVTEDIPKVEAEPKPETPKAPTPRGRKPSGK